MVSGGVYQGQDLFDRRTSLIQYRELFNAFPDEIELTDEQRAKIRTLVEAFKVATKADRDALTPNSPDNLNPSQFCDREVDRTMAEATRLQAVDPGAADALWARAERLIVDAAEALS